MKFIDQVSPEKLRGGFYTPARLVRACFDRIESLADKDGELSILEPAAGDGAFVRFAGPGCPADAKFTCVELMPEEAEKCRRELEERRYQGRVINDRFFAWAVKQPPEFSALVAGVHNSLTILSSETEGRTYGGGVLEMVPSEIARLLVPLVDMQSSLALLDATCRRAGGQLDATDTLIHATDRILCRLVPGYSSLLPDLTAVRRKLRQRRLVGVEDWGEGP